MTKRVVSVPRTGRSMNSSQNNMIGVLTAFWIEFDYRSRVGQFFFLFPWGRGIVISAAKDDQGLDAINSIGKNRELYHCLSFIPP